MHVPVHLDSDPDGPRSTLDIFNANLFITLSNSGNAPTKRQARPLKTSSLDVETSLYVGVIPVSQMLKVLPITALDYVCYQDRRCVNYLASEAPHIFCSNLLFVRGSH